MSCEIDGRVYHEVKLDEHGRKVILNLPATENPADYEICIASLEIFRQLHTTYVAIKKDSQTILERCGWEDKGGSLRSG